jgi:hypothetical protein
MRDLYTSHARPVPDGGRAPDTTRASVETEKYVRNRPLIDESGRRPVGETGVFTADLTDMNRRYAYRDYEILVSAQPAPGQAGWRPEICVIAPDDHWQFVPTHHSLMANDPQYCLEIGRRCAESAIQSMDPAREKADIGLLH